MENYKYEVAFSFLKEDESIASEINDMLQDRMQTFLYSKEQENLAGRDGEESFNEIFLKDSRIVVVLYRKGWGETSWTRIEQTAIKNRAYDKGYDFTLFIPLDNPPLIPDWLPKTQLWYGLDRFGVDGAVSVIESKIQQQGGNSKIESIEEQAARQSREIKDKERRESFINSIEGVQSARQEIQNMYKHLQEKCTSITKQNHFILECEYKNEFCSIYSNGFTFYFGLTGYSTQKSLFVKLFKGRVRLNGSGVNLNKIRGYIFEFAINNADEKGWKDQESKKFYTTFQLAEHKLRELLDTIHQTEI